MTTQANPKPTRQELKIAYAKWEAANDTSYATDCNDELYAAADATAEAAWAAYCALCQRVAQEGVQP